MLIRLTLLSLLFQDFLLSNAVSAIYMPDCSKEKHKKKPQCICKNPANWSLQVCDNWWHKPDIEQSVQKMTRIVGGELAPRDAYPWFARLIERNGSWWGCGGMLIAKEYVLTAAHCVSNNDILSVEIGAVCPYSNNNCGQPVQTIEVTSVQRHPQYNSVSLANDFALLKLNTRANAEPVPIDQGNVVNNYSSSKRGLYAIGFGSLSSGGNVASELRRVELAYVDRNTCNSSYGGDITNVMMCASDPGQDSCQGDSGGPLYDQANNALVGVVSWGYGCADPNYPGVYAQVSTRFSWIKANTCGTDNHSNPQPAYCDNIAPTPTPPTTTASPVAAPTPPTTTASPVAAPTPPTTTASPVAAPTPPTPTADVPNFATEPCVDNRKKRFAISIKTDTYGSETYVDVYRRRKNGSFTNLVYTRGGNFPSESTINLSKCLPKRGCYQLVMFDSYGDGMCCEYGAGSFQGYWDGAKIRNIDAVFDNGSFSETESFGQC